MIFPYIQISPGIKRPIIPIILKSKDKFIYYPVLVDSGSDYCIFSIEIAQHLGINLGKKRVGLLSLGKGKLFGRLGKVEIRIAEKFFIIESIFADISEFGHGILGQKGFFSNFDVKFSYKNETIEINASRFASKGN